MSLERNGGCADWRDRSASAVPTQRQKLLREVQLLPIRVVHCDSSITSMADMVAKFTMGSKVRLSLPSGDGFRW